MPQENIEVVREAYERLNAGNVDGFLELCAADVEFRDLPALPGSGVHRGRDGVLAWVVKLDEAFADLTWEIERLHEAGDNVVMESRAVGRGRESGVDVDLEFFLVVTLREKSMQTIVAHGDRTNALKAAGLSE